jgi:hypothetical protein
MIARANVVLSLLLIVMLAVSAQAGDLTASLKKGAPDLKSAGPLAFGPDGVLFVGDTQGAAVFALDTGDRTLATSAGEINVAGINEKIASLVGTTPDRLLINDLAVNPASGKAYLSVSRGRGPDATPVIVRVDRAAKIESLSLADIAFSKAPLPSVPDIVETPKKGQPSRAESITDLAFVNGRVYVAGLSNEEFASRLLSIPFPFSETGKGTSIEIYHGAHGRFETRSPIRTFVPFDIDGEANLLAAYTCTPLVKIPVSELKPGSHLKGTTVAELGNQNRPLDMITYKKSGKDFLLLANSARGIMKITTEGMDKAESITEPVRGGGKKGQSYETIEAWKGVLQLDRLDDTNAIVIAQADGGAQDLRTVPLP